MMKKYKLIKEYPGSKKLGTIVQNQHDSLYFPETKETNSSTGRNYFQKMVACQPEFWEEVVEKEYEIVSFIHNGEHQVKIDTIIKIKNGFLDSTSQKLPLEHYLNAKCWNINSVKRLSDSEIFSIGDNTNGGIIKSISILGNTLDFKVNGSCFLDGLFKIKKPLFTTEDGVDIYEGDSYFLVLKDKFEITKTFVEVNLQEYFIRRSTAYWKFSTKESAEEYILMNKPCLSINDVAKYLIKHMPLAYKRDIIINDLKERR